MSEESRQPDRDATVKALHHIALMLYVVKPDYVQAAFDAIELISGQKYEDDGSVLDVIKEQEETKQ